MSRIDAATAGLKEQIPDDPKVQGAVEAIEAELAYYRTKPQSIEPVPAGENVIVLGGAAAVQSSG